MCSCNGGYGLHGDKRSCVDINECAEGISGCAQLCNNTQGGYACGCQAGYQLSGKTCSPLPCPALTPPTNGLVYPNVTGVTGEVRSFLCNNGYTLTGGHTTTTCMSPSWSASPPTCVASAGSLGSQSIPATSCMAIKSAGYTLNGLYWVNPSSPIQVYCDLEFGFTVRGDASVMGLICLSFVTILFPSYVSSYFVFFSCL